MPKPPCSCPAYRFPHRRGGGACLYNPANGPTCAHCGQPCIVEYHPGMPPDNEIEAECYRSACCDATVVEEGVMKRPEEPLDELRHKEYTTP